MTQGETVISGIAGRAASVSSRPRMVRWCRTAVVIVALLAVSACGSTTAPSSPYDGTWSGIATDALLGQGTLSMTISGESSALTGSWSLVFAGSASANVAGTLNGNPGGSTEGITLVFAKSGTSCNGLSAIVSVSGSAMTGTYDAVGLGCAYGHAQLALTKQ